MPTEQILAEVVRAWAEEVAPGDQEVATRVEAVALGWFREGATVSEACRYAGTLLDSWIRHPAHWSADREPVVRLAS
jgi:hypothetical protein